MLAKHTKKAIIKVLSFIFKARIPLQSRVNNNILLIHHYFIGDIVFITPMIRTLKITNCNSSIDLFCNITSEPIVRNNIDLRRIYIDATPITRKNNIPNITRKLFKNINNVFAIRKRRYDILIDCSGYMDTVLFTIFSGAKFKIGHSVEKAYKPFYNKFNDLSQPKAIHLKDRYLELLTHIGIDKSNWHRKYEVTIDTQSINFAEKKIRELNSPLIITIAPFAGWSSKEWELEKFASLCNEINKAYSNINFIILGGKRESEILKNKNICWPSNTLNMTGKLTLLESAAFISKSRLFIGLDSGLSHIAEAIETPSIEIYTSTNPIFSGPEQQDKHIIVKPDTHCIPTGSKQYCNDSEFYLCDRCDCQKNISVETVFSAASKLLK